MITNFLFFFEIWYQNLFLFFRIFNPSFFFLSLIMNFWLIFIHFYIYYLFSSFLIRRWNKVKNLKMRSDSLTPHSPMIRSQVPACMLQSHFTHASRSWWSVSLDGTLVYPQAHFWQDIPSYPSGQLQRSTKLAPSSSPESINSPAGSITSNKLKFRSIIQTTLNYFEIDKRIIVKISILPSFYLLGVILSPDQEILEVRQDWEELESRYRIATKFCTSQSRRYDMTGLFLHVVPSSFV